MKFKIFLISQLIVFPICFVFCDNKIHTDCDSKIGFSDRPKTQDWTPSTSPHFPVNGDIASALISDVFEPFENPINECQPIYLKGIVLISSREEMVSEEELDRMDGIWIKGVNIPGRISTFEDWITPLYHNQPVEKETLQNLKIGLHDYFEYQAHPFVIVSIPPQKITSGVLQIEVEEGEIGEISVEGNRWTSNSMLLSYLDMSSGDLINEASLLKGIEFINRNPFRKVDVVYKTGKEKKQTDITLAVQDEKLYHLYVGTDNTGVPTTGRHRYFVGLTWNQVFGLDHVLFYQYTTSQRFKCLQAHTAQYLAFLPTKTILNIFGGYSTVHAHLSQPNRKNSGQSIQGSLRHTAPLNAKYPFVHELTIGFDYKQTNNTVEFVDFNPTFGSIVNLTEMMAGYRLKSTHDFSSNDFNVELFISPGEWLPHQKNSNFNSLRLGATNHWVFLRGSWRHNHNLPKDWSCSLLSRFEWASNPLLPSEQLGIGGFESVRGYDERELDADTGGFLSFELKTPSFQIFTKKTSQKKDAARFLLFLDGGLSYDKIAVPTTKQFDYIIGAGPGMRYSFSTYLNGRLDLGFKLRNQSSFTGGNPMIHFSVIGNY